VKLTVNGTAHQCDVPPDTPAVFVLRNDLRLHGVRLGCGEGHCGSCTVLVDGKPLTSCDLPMSALEGRSVTTLEGLGSEDRPHAIQSAMLEADAGQCGFCWAGIMMTAAALVDSPQVRTEQEVREALDKHLCRCGSHPRLVAAIMRCMDTKAAAA
jgi:aerobic-type carbon monoxide dehydrogenase small subunit (CoxS/CutS family)